MLYFMFLLKAKLFKRDKLSVVDQKAVLKFSKGRNEGYNRSIKHGLTIKEDDDFDGFWNETNESDPSVLFHRSGKRQCDG